MSITPQDALLRTIEHREIFHDEMLQLMRLIMKREADEVHAALCIQDNDQRVIAHVTHGKYDASVPDPAGHVTHHKMLTFGERYHRLIAVSRSPLRPEHRILIQHCGSLADLLL